jgi:hypothetical protein
MKVVTEKVIQLFAVFAIGVAAGLYFSGEREHPPGSRAFAQQNDVVAESAPTTFSPKKAFSNRDIYYPGTEDLQPDEMRVTALGTGMPSPRNNGLTAFVGMALLIIGGVVRSVGARGLAGSGVVLNPG